MLDILNDNSQMNPVSGFQSKMVYSHFEISQKSITISQVGEISWEFSFVLADTLGHLGASLTVKIQ